jgi:hypothetical protein
VTVGVSSSGAESGHLDESPGRCPRRRAIGGRFRTEFYLILDIRADVPLLMAIPSDCTGVRQAQAVGAGTNSPAPEGVMVHGRAASLMLAGKPLLHPYTSQ